MTEEELAQLTSLLKKLRKSKLVPPNTPYKVWKELGSIIPWPAIEVLVTRNGKDFLLTYRKDKYWDSWHIPGGFMGIHESIEDTCKRIAKKELGIDVKLQKVQTAKVWGHHPFVTTPVSILCICTTNEKSKDGKFFEKIPVNTIRIHRDLLNEFIAKGHKSVV